MTGTVDGVMSLEDIAKRDADHGFTDADLAEVMDNPEWSDEELRNARPFAEVSPDLATSIKRGFFSKKVERERQVAIVELFTPQPSPVRPRPSLETSSPASAAS